MISAYCPLCKGGLMITYEELQRLFRYAEEMFRVECLEKGVDGGDDAQIHIRAVKAIFHAFWEFNYFSKEAIFAITAIPEESRLYSIILGPYLKIIDDKALIAEKYATMYLHYFSKKLEGEEDEMAVRVLFHDRERRAADAVT
jgi:hypothetical protein